MATPYILARTIADAHAFARGELGLSKGQYRIVNSVGTLKAVRNVNLYLVPGWEKRYDRFAMRGALRWTRMTVVDPAAEQDQEPAGVPDGLDPAGEQLTIEDAHAFVMAAGVPNEELKTLVETPTPTERAEESVRRRRKRCSRCGTLVDPDDVERHLREHLPEDV